MNKNAATLNAQGVLKLPKKKKVLTEEEQVNKDLTALFKKPLALTIHCQFPVINPRLEDSTSRNPTEPETSKP